MARFTICCKVDAPDEMAATTAWMGKWKGKVAFLSRNLGCGCCVVIYNVEGPDEAGADLPPNMLASSEWTRDGTGKRRP